MKLKRLFKTLFAWLVITMLMSISAKAQNYPTQHYWGDVTIEVGEELELWIGDDFLFATEAQGFFTQWTFANNADKAFLSIDQVITTNPYCTIKGLQECDDPLGIRVNCDIIYKSLLPGYNNTVWHGYYIVHVFDKPKLTLSANPAGGTVEEGTKVYLSASQSDANIYYTLNGNTPTESSTKYTSSGITINESCTLKAIAMKSGYNNSDVMTWTYTIEDVIEINATNFPDANFRDYLLEQSYGKDGFITNKEIANITSISVNGKNISSLKGIEHFTALKQLFCRDNQLTALDVSKNTALTSLVCYGNQLTVLDVSKNTALTSLVCYDNQLTALDVSKNMALEYLTCYDNQLTALDVSKNTALTSLACYDNQLTALDVSKNMVLEYLACYDNQLTALDVSKNTALEYLACHDNQLIALDISKNTALTSLVCYDNQLTALDLSKNTVLESLQCQNNQLTTLDVSKNTALTWLNCCGNPLKSMDVSKNTALITYYCGDNQLTSVDISKNTKLKEFTCYANQLTSLDVSKNVELTFMNCSRNMIKGAAMDALISGLPVNTTGDNVGKTYSVYLYNDIQGIEGNVCTKKQVAAFKAKGWIPKYYAGTGVGWLEYEGSDEEDFSEVVIDETNFPDANFRAYLLTQDYGRDGVITKEEINGITRIWLPNKNINSLKGIEYFTALEHLSCENNQLTSLDVSNNIALNDLSCYSNKIRGEAMDVLISSLPLNTTNNINPFYVINDGGEVDGNICTKSQVAAALAKGWDPCTSEALTYEGSDDEPTEPISITLPEIETVNVNSTLQLTPIIEPADAVTELTWSSDDETIAKVTSIGLVAGIKAGTAIISVHTSNGLSAECFVIVQDDTGIEHIKMDRNKAPIYTFDGMRLNTTNVSDLPAGIYIVNGKKVVVK